MLLLCCNGFAEVHPVRSLSVPPTGAGLAYLGSDMIVDVHLARLSQHGLAKHACCPCREMRIARDDVSITLLGR